MLQMKGIDIISFTCDKISFSRGIDVVREKIKGFAQKKINLPPGKQLIFRYGPLIL